VQYGGGKELATLPHLTPGLVRLAVVVWGVLCMGVCTWCGPACADMCVHGWCVYEHLVLALYEDPISFRADNCTYIHWNFKKVKENALLIVNACKCGVMGESYFQNFTYFVITWRVYLRECIVLLILVSVVEIIVKPENLSGNEFWKRAESSFTTLCKYKIPAVVRKELLEASAIFWAVYFLLLF
jgi:hypothetical protein